MMITFTTHSRTRPWAFLCDTCKVSDREAERIFTEECERLPEPLHEAPYERRERLYRITVNCVRRAKELPR